MSGEITELTRLSSSTVRSAVEIPNRNELVFLPGQYVNIAVPGTDESRSYSFSNAPDEKVLTFLVKLTPGGVMSTYLDERAKVGDKLTFTGPNGSFFLREGEGPALLLAGGTGLAPILSILRTMRDSGSRRLHLIYGVNTDKDAVELDTAGALADELGGLTWEYCVADKASSAVHKGFVTNLIEPEHLYGGEVSVYLCGPPPMVEAVRKHLEDAGVEPVGFYYERFALSGTRAAARVEVPDEPEVVAEAEAPTAAAPPVPERAPAAVEVAAVLTGPEGRAVAGQTIWPSKELAPLRGVAVATSPVDEAAMARVIAGQSIARAGSDVPVSPLDAGGQLIEAGDEIGCRTTGNGPRRYRPVRRTRLRDRRGSPVGAHLRRHLRRSGGARTGRARADHRQADLATVDRVPTAGRGDVPYVEGEHFVDAAAYTDTNAVFHDYLFNMTGNEHLLQAYNNLGVKGKMHDVLRHATWCDPRVAQDHLDIVAAFEAGDRDAARQLISDHADRSKQTMRRALDESRGPRTAGVVQPRPVRRQGRPGHRCRAGHRADGGQADRRGGRQRWPSSTGRNWCIRKPGGSRASGVPRRRDHRGHGNVGRCLSSRRTGNKGTGPDRRADQQCRRSDQLQAIHRVHRRRDPRRDRPLLADHPVCLPRRAALDGEAGPRRDRQRLVGGDPRHPPHSVLGGKGGRQRPHRIAGDGVRRCRRPRGRHRAGGHRGAATPDIAGHTGAPQRIEQAWYQAHIDQTIDSSLLKRYGTLDEQAAAICFLASDEASYITGTVLPVAGGDLG